MRSDPDTGLPTDPLYALLAVALLSRRDELKHGPYAAQVAALDALMSLMTLAREQAVRKGKLQEALPAKQARRKTPAFLPGARSPL